jgi:capsular exopolysaccharide synthesis family protein
MAAPRPGGVPHEENKIDFRIYLGIILFRWQLIAVCFLYALLGAVMYLHLAPKKYESTTKIMIYRDPLLTVSREGAQWTSLHTHTYMLRNEKMHEQVVARLTEAWADRLGGRHRMQPDIAIAQVRGVNPMLSVTVQARDKDYTAAFLKVLIEEHEQEWQNVQRQARNSAGAMLEKELARLEQQIQAAESDLIEYQRLHDIARVEARGTMESRYLSALMERRNQLTTELMLLEAQTPALEGANASVISDVVRLTRATGEIKAVEGSAPEGETEPDRDTDVTTAETQKEDQTIQGFQNLRVRLLRLEAEQQELLKVLKGDHPRLRAVRDEIRGIQEQIDAMAEVQVRNLQDRHRALSIQLSAIETAEYKWQAKNLMASQRQAEYARLRSVVERFTSHYNTLYTRLHDMRVSEELKAEHFVPEDVTTNENPVWPDPAKILMAALAGGLGLGFGLAFLMQVMDNKVQTIKDVEVNLGVPFLGGIPYWAHSGLESAIRPIVTEEHSTGAIEAYRALRTSVLAELAKKHEKILLITSADSREGKTLTALNMAIMVAQMGKRVLLVDMDLRRGRIHRSLGLEREPGVTDVLREGGSLKDVIQTARIANLYFAPSGSGIDDSAELLQTVDVARFFFDVLDDFDYIFVDTSPVLRVTDTVILASQGIGQVLYVARVNFTPKPMIRYSLDMLKDANILGLVMNSIEMHKISSLYYAYQYPNYAYYSNAYTYGYNYYYYDDNGGSGRRHRRHTAWQRQLERAGSWIRKMLMPMP